MEGVLTQAILTSLRFLSVFGVCVAAIMSLYLSACVCVCVSTTALQ